MTRNRKGTLLGSPALKGIAPPKTSKQKRAAEDKRRKESNDELRTARCIVCRGPRDGGTYPIHRGTCTTRKPKDGVVTWRPYLSKYFTPEESISV